MRVLSGEMQYCVQMAAKTSPFSNAFAVVLLGVQHGRFCCLEFRGQTEELAELTTERVV